MKEVNWSRYNFLWDSIKYGKFLYNSYTNAFIKFDGALFSDDSA
ncbi:MAG: hypothetical protein N4A49_05080 [Marinifilaceae bacterium]|jgi:hypothetical protein|nr:hypothetical protein [Marinifilaceae bacterium]